MGWCERVWVEIYLGMSVWGAASHGINSRKVWEGVWWWTHIGGHYVVVVVVDCELFGGGAQCTGYGWSGPEPYIHTVHDRMYGDFPAKYTYTVCTLYIRINIWFWPTLATELFSVWMERDLK